jgi:hypothetical protein
MIAHKGCIITNKIAVKHVFRNCVCATQGVDPVTPGNLLETRRQRSGRPLPPEDDMADKVVGRKRRPAWTKLLVGGLYPIGVVGRPVDNSALASK